MEIYVFASTSLENIRRGIANCLWAVPPMEGPLAAARRTRADDMPLGAAGLFYCSEPQIFTTPFIVESEPQDRIVSDVWELAWQLPFKIRPIGDMKKMVSLNHAALTWPFVRDTDNRGGLLTGARAFAPIRILRHEWDEILKQLGVEPEEYEELW